MSSEATFYCRVSIKLLNCLFLVGIILTPLKNRTGIQKESQLRQPVGFEDMAADVSESAQTRKFRIRRNVMQMARMLKCMSGCNPLSYRGYGCYCGYMGSGQPVDDIDR